MPEHTLIESARMAAGLLNVSITTPDPNDASKTITEVITVPLPAPVSVGRQEGPPGDLDRPWHSPNFSRVRWGRFDCHFSKTQRAVVAHLWQAMEGDDPFVEQFALLRAAESDCLELRDLFRKSKAAKAWGPFVQLGSAHGGPPGTYRLGDPNLEMLEDES